MRYRFVKIMFLAFMFLPAAVFAASGQQDLDTAAGLIAIQYAVGLVVIAIFVAGSLWFSKSLHRKLEEFEKDKNEKTSQSGEPSWKSRFQDSFPAQKQEKSSSSQEKDQKEGPRQ